MFNENDLTSELKKGIYKVKELVLQPTFLEDLERNPEYCTLPKWLSKFTMLEKIRFRFVKLNNLEDLADLPVQHIIFDNIQYSDIGKMIRDIKKIKYLHEISYDQSLPSDIIKAIEGFQIRCTVINDAD